MAKCAYYNFEELRQQAFTAGLAGKIATHHIKLYHLVAGMNTPLVVEFGVEKGRSTCVFLQACEETIGKLISVDILDCSDVATSKRWEFIQQSDLDKDTLLAAAPQIQQGIDLLHIDSKHSREHLKQLLMTWYPFVKPGGYITFHDVDPTPYLAGQRKDNPRHEPEAIGMATVIRDFFYANEDQLFLEYHFGSTGMGIMKKLAPLGNMPNPPVGIRTRQTVVSLSGLFWSARNTLVRLVKRNRV